MFVLFPKFLWFLLIFLTNFVCYLSVTTVIVSGATIQTWMARDCEASSSGGSTLAHTPETHRTYRLTPITTTTSKMATRVASYFALPSTSMAGRWVYPRRGFSGGESGGVGGSIWRSWNEAT